MLLHDVEAMRDQISMYKTCVTSGVIQMFDYYESRDFMYFCLDKNNDISEKEILTLQDMCQKVKKDGPLLNCLRNIAKR
jgi:hypothetical protein